MRIIKEKAEKDILKTLRDLKQHEPATRCLLLPCSQLSVRLDEDWLEEMARLLEEFIGHKDGWCFRCYDNDVLFFSRHLTPKSLTFLLSHPKLGWLASLNRESATLFEIGFDAGRIATIVQRKVDTIETTLAKALERQKFLKDKQKEEALNAPIEENILDSIADRRRGRTKAIALIVEDDLFTQKLIRKAIPETIDVVVADCAAKALLLYARHAPDICFLDIGLPDVDGHGVLDKCLEMDRDAFIVMLSGNGNRENVLKAIHTGAKGFVGKPFTAAKLMEYLEQSPHMNQKGKREVV